MLGSNGYRALLSLPVLFVLAASACSNASGQTGDPWGRRADGLLTDPALQQVVDAQVRRDAGALAGFLASDQPVVRARAAFALGSVQDLRARPLLFGLLADPDARVRADAAFAIGQLPDTSNTGVLIDRLREEIDPDVRLQLIQAVGRAGGRGAAARLLRTDIEESELPTLGLALARLGNRGVNNAVAVELQVEMMNHEDRTVRRNASFYFGRSAALSFWAPVVPRLRDRLATLDRDDPTAMWILRALAKVNEPVDTDAAVGWLGEASDWRIRHAAADLLTDRVAGGAVTLALMAALGDASPHVREAAAKGISSRSRPLTQQDHIFLTAWIQEHEDDLTTISALLPARVTEDPLWVLEWGDRYPAASPQRAAVLQALGVLPGLEVVEREFAAAAGDGPVAQVGLAALERRIPAANPTRLVRIFETASAAIASGDPTKTQLGAVLLANPRVLPLGSVEAVGTALGRATDVNIRRTMYRALVSMGDSTAMPWLQRGLSSEDAEIQAISAAGVQALTGIPPEYQALPRDVPAVDWAKAAERGRHPQVVFETRLGEIAIELDAEQAPLTSQTIIDLVETGAFDDVPFHRVVGAFVVQGGDVTSGDGFGSAPTTIRSEFTRIPFDRGVAGMASSGKDTEGSQFFITHLITPHLDGAYTSFGRVVSGQDVVDQLTRGETVTRARWVSSGEA